MMSKRQVEARRESRWLSSELISPRALADPSLMARIASHMRNAVIQSMPNDREVREWLANSLDQLPAGFKSAFVGAELGELDLEFAKYTRSGDHFFAAPLFWATIEAATSGIAPSIAASDGTVFSIRKADPSGSADGFVFQSGETSYVDRSWYLRIASPDPRAVFDLLELHRAELDMSPDTFAEFAQRLSELSTPYERAEELFGALDGSLPLYLRELSRLVEADGFVSWENLIPPKASALLDYLRLSDKGDLGEAAEHLVAELPLGEAWLRLSGLPVRMPPAVLQKVTLLEPAELVALLEGISGRAKTPVAALQILRLAAMMPESSIANDILNVLILQANEMFESGAFAQLLQLLGWISNELNRWPETERWSPSERLAAVWAYGNVLFPIINAPKAKEAWRESVLGANRGIFEERLFAAEAYVNDIANPLRVSPRTLFASGTSDSLLEVRKARLSRDSINAIASSVLAVNDGEVVPNLDQFQDVRAFDNSLGSFVGVCRSSILKPIVGDGIPITNRDRSRLIRDSLEKVESRPDDRDGWSDLVQFAFDAPLYVASHEQRLRKVLSSMPMKTIAALDVDIWRVVSVLRATRSQGVSSSVRRRWREDFFESLLVLNLNPDTEKAIVDGAMQVALYDSRATGRLDTTRRLSQVLLRIIGARPDITRYIRKFVLAFSRRLPIALACELEHLNLAMRSH